MAKRYEIQGAPELASRLRRALDQQQISGGELELTFSPEILVKDASQPPFIQDPIYFAAPETAGPVAAELSHAGIRFNGPGLLVIDKVTFWSVTAQFMHLRFGRTIAALTPGLTTNVHDRADLRGVGVDTVAMTSIQGLQDTDAAAQGTLLALMVAGANVQTVLDGLDIVMAPGDDLFLVGQTVNLAIFSTFFGRWFPNAIQS